MGRIEDIDDDKKCAITFESFDEWLDRMGTIGVLSYLRIDAIRKGLSYEADYLERSYNIMSKIDETLCDLRRKKEELEINIKRKGKK